MNDACHCHSSQAESLSTHTRHCLDEREGESDDKYNLINGLVKEIITRHYEVLLDSCRGWHWSRGQPEWRMQPFTGPIKSVWHKTVLKGSPLASSESDGHKHSRVQQSMRNHILSAILGCWTANNQKCTRDDLSSKRHTGATLNLLHCIIKPRNNIAERGAGGRGPIFLFFFFWKASIFK